MTNSEGIVIFAYNSTFDYVKIAGLCAALTKKYTKPKSQLDLKISTWPPLPVTLITDDFGALQCDRDLFDNVIIHSSNGTNKRRIRAKHDSGPMQTINWKNLNRADVYDITGKNEFKNDSRLNLYSVPMLWATVIYFRKSKFSKSIFDMMKIIQENYAYYAKVYGFKPTPFRNDFALSIAHHAMSGYGPDKLLPYKLTTLSPMTDVIDFRSDGELLYQYKQDNKMWTGISTNTDLHIMNKSIFTDDIVDKMLSYAKKR